MKRLIYLLLLGAVVACSDAAGDGPTTTPPPPTADGWAPVATADGSAPVARHEAAFVRVADKYYLLGGRGIRPVSIYDPATRVWTTGSPPPVEIHHFQPVVHGGKILLLGAMTGGYPGETPLPDIQIYDPATDAWSTGAPLPAERRRGGAGAVAHDGKIYLVCGITDGHRGGHVAWLDEYDPATGAWVRLPDAPRPRDHFQAVVHAGKLYALAGRTTVAATNPFANTIGEVDVYDFADRSWTTLRDTLPTHRAGNAAAVVNDEVWVLGGESAHQVVAHSEVESLNPATGAWSIRDSLSRGRHGTGVVQHDGRLLMASGCGHRGGEPELADLIALPLD